MLTQHFISTGLCTTTKKWCGTEETWKTSKYYFPCPPLLRSTQSDFSDMGTWNWKSENRNAIINETFFLCVCLTYISPVVRVTLQLWLFDHIVFQTYSMSVYLVRQLTSPLLLQRLRMKGIRNPDHSRALSINTVNELCNVTQWKLERKRFIR